MHASRGIYSQAAKAPTGAYVLIIDYHCLLYHYKNKKVIFGEAITIFINTAFDFEWV